MTTHDDYMTQRQARDLARRLARLERRQRSTAAAHADLRHSAIDGGKGLVLKDEQGQEKYRLGTDENGVTAPQYKGGPVPEQPSAPFVDVGGEVVKIQHSGLDVEENPAPADFQRAQIHVAQDEVFEPSLSTLAGYLEEADGSFTHRLPGGEWYVGIVWETLSGKTSVMSGTVLADIPPLVDTSDLEDTLAAAEEKLNTYRDEVAAPRFQALETGLSESNDSLDDARTRLSAAEQTLSPLPGRIESAEQDVATAQVEATKAAAAAVEANNRAMTRLANGNFESGLDYWDHDNVSLTSTAHSGQQAAQIGGWLRPGSSFPVVPDQIWELSLYYQYDVTVELQAIDGYTRTVLSTHHLDGDSTWSDSGALRVTIPADVHMLSFTITGTSAIVDDITLRDVTDVVRLEAAANANRQKAEQAISELAVLQLAVDGEGGLKDRLTTAETVLEDKADESALEQLDQKLAGDLAAFEAHYTRVWHQPTPPPPGTHYAWLGERHASMSVRLDGDGNEIARNYFTQPRDFAITGSDRHAAVDISTPGRIEAITDYPLNAYSTGVPPYGDPDFLDGDYERTYTLSVEVRASFQNPNGHTQLRYDLRPQNIQADTPLIRDTAGEWVRISATLTLPADEQGDTSLINFRNWQNITAGDVIEYRNWKFERGAPATPYFDGDTASDRANDLWYNSDGVPHEWVNGTNGEPGGWVELSDDRINQLQTDVVEAAETAYLDRLVVRDEIVTPETITNRLWADLGVFNRLQAREGWIGGTLLADGAITAEKIHATRELITKIMGAEWAYIAQQLIVDGKILTRDLEALSAAIQSLTVTQRADIAELWADELWTALAVVEELQSEEAWITSAMISELTAEKVTVTEEFVARVGAFAEILGNKLWANEAFIDRMRASDAHFGSEDADTSTRVDGTGLRITKHDRENETSTDIVRLGGAGIGLVFSDEDGEITGSLSHEGDASFRDTSVDRITIGGRLLLPETDPAEFWDGNLWDSQPKGLVCFHEVDMAGVSVNHYEYGFIEVSHHVRANRMYRVSTNNFLMDNSTAHYGRFRYTIGDNPDAPHTESPQLGNTWLINTSTTGNVQTRGDHTFTPETDGLMRILLCVSRIGSTPGISFNSLSSLATAQLRLEDLGPARPYTGMTRNAGHGGAGTVRDPRPLVGGITTAWDMTWYQNYSHGGTQRRSSSTTTGGYGAAGLTQGMRQDSARTEGIWSSLFGFTTSTESTNPDDLGVSLAAALNGADILSMHLEVTNHFAWQSNGSTRYVFWHHNHTTAPNQYSAAPDSIGDHLLRLGNRARIPLPLDQLADRAANGQLTGFGVANAENTSPLYAGQLSWAQPPRLVVTYQR